MIGRRNTKMPTPAGIVSSAVIRTPSDAWSTNAGTLLAGHGTRHLGLERRGDRHGEQSVGQHEERERGEVGGRVTGPGLGEVADDDERDLVGGDETDRPERQPEQPTDGRMAELEHRPEPEPGANMAGMSTIAIEAMPSVAPSPRVYFSRSSLSTSSSTQSAEPASGNDSSVAMMITFGRIGLHAAAKNRRRLLRNAFASPTSP